MLYFSCELNQNLACELKQNADKNGNQKTATPQERTVFSAIPQENPAANRVENRAGNQNSELADLMNAAKSAFGW
jgi:hypothetical protein